MLASEFADLFGLRIERCDHKSQGRGYERYRVIYSPNEQVDYPMSSWYCQDSLKEAFVVSFFDLDGLFPAQQLGAYKLESMVKKHLIYSCKLLGFKETITKESYREGYFFKKRYEECLKFLDGNDAFKDLPITHVAKVLLGKESLEDDISKQFGIGQGFSMRVVADAWFAKHRESFKKELLEAMQVTNSNILCERLADALDDKFPCVTTQEGIKEAEKYLGCKHTIKNCSAWLMQILYLHESKTFKGGYEVNGPFDECEPEYDDTEDNLDDSEVIEESIA